MKLKKELYTFFQSEDRTAEQSFNQNKYYERSSKTGKGYVPRLYELEHPYRGKLYVMGSCHDHVMDDITPQVKTLIDTSSHFALESKEVYLDLSAKKWPILGMDCQLTEYAESQEKTDVFSLETEEEQIKAGEYLDEVHEREQKAFEKQIRDIKKTVGQWSKAPGKYEEGNDYFDTKETLKEKYGLETFQDNVINVYENFKGKKKSAIEFFDYSYSSFDREEHDEEEQDEKPYDLSSVSQYSLILEKLERQSKGSYKTEATDNISDLEVLDSSTSLTDDSQESDIIEAKKESELGGQTKDSEHDLVSRNKRMVSRLMDKYDQTKVTQLFAVVGDKHLEGEEGMLNLLQQKGYTCQAVTLEKKESLINELDTLKM